MSGDLYSLYEDQHKAVGRIVRRERLLRRGQQGAAKGEDSYRPPIRVMALTTRSYNSVVPEELPVFVWDAERTVFNIVQVGSSLAGYIALTINGTRHLMECRRSTLTDLETAVPGMRATVFPGMWELDFGILTDRKSAAVTVSAERITDDENTTLCELFDDVLSVIYTGALIVRQEAWCSVGDRSRETAPAVVHREVTDSIPYQTGAVKSGAIGTAVWSWDAGYLVTAWECRSFSHATGYVEADDPVLYPPEDEGGTGGGGSGGGGPTGPEEPPPLGP